MSDAHIRVTPDMYTLTPLGVTNLIDEKMKKLFPQQWSIFVLDNQEKKSPYRSILKSGKVIYLSSTAKWNMKQHKSPLESVYNKSEYYHLNLDLSMQVDEDVIILFLFYISLMDDVRAKLRIRMDIVVQFVALASAYIPGIIKELVRKIDCYFSSANPFTIANNYKNPRYRLDLSRYIISTYLEIFHFNEIGDNVKENLDTILRMLPHTMYQMTHNYVDYSFLVEKGCLDSDIGLLLESSEEEMKKAEEKALYLDICPGKAFITVEDVAKELGINYYMFETDLIEMMKILKIPKSCDNTSHLKTGYNRVHFDTLSMAIKLAQNLYFTKDTYTPRFNNISPEIFSTH